MSLEDALAAFAGTTDAMDETQNAPSFGIEQQAQSASAPNSLDSAIATWADQEQKDSLQASSSLGLKKDPAKATKVLQLFGKTGLPQDFIERNQDFVERESIKQDFNPDKLMKESPAFAKWLAESPDHVAAVKHEAPTLIYLERQWRRIQAAGESGPLTLELADLGNKAFDGTITPTDRARQAEIESRLQTLGKSAEENDITGFFEGIPAAVVEQGPIFLRSLSGKVKGAGEGAAIGAAAGAVAGAATMNPALPAAGSLLGAVTGWRYGAAIEAGKIEGGMALLDYEKLKDEQGNPLDRTTIKGLALMAGAINGTLEGLTGVEALANKLPGVRNLTRSGIKELLKTPTARGAILGMAKQVGDTMLTEGVTEALQMYVTKAGGVLSQWAQDGGGPVEVLGKIFSAENAAQAVQEFKGGAQGGGGMAVVMTAPSVIQDLKQVRQAEQNQRAFEAMGKAAESSQFAKDLPDHLKAIIAEATKNGPVEQVYIPTDAFNTYFQGKGVDPREVAAAITGNVEAYDQAVQTGQDFAIPTADYVSKIAGTEHNAFFAHELRTSLDAMNAREAEDWQTMMTEQEQAAQEGVQAAPMTDPSAKIRQDIAGQLQGFASPDVIDQYAATMGERYLARAVRRGLGEDPFELFQRMNLQVTRQIPAILQQLNTQQTELDALLNRLRVGDAPKAADIFGQSLTEFLKAKGGVQDQGGELSAKNVDANRKPFQKKLVQKGGKTLDDAATSAYEAGYIASPNIADLLEALDQEAQQKPVYAIGKENARLLDVHTNLDALKHFLDSRSIDLNATSNEQIKALLGESVQQTLPAVDGQTFAQNDGSPKASITFGDNQVSIKLLEKADLSSFIHETGHLYLNELIEDATTADTNEQLRTDLDTILKWMGLEVTSASGKDAIKAAIQTTHHEQFARGWEAYAMEGKAPSQALREAFARFRQWMIQVYRSLTTSPLNVKLTKSVREVMDRLIATDDAINAAAAEADVLPIFTDAESAGMTPTQWHAYQDLVAKASLTARETLQAKLMKEYQREQTDWWKEKRMAMVETITNEVNEEPEYIALAVLKTGKMPDGADIPHGIQPMKLDKKGLAEVFGKDFLKRLPKGLTAKDGMHHDAVAQLFGFSNGQDFVMALVNARDKHQLIEAETDRRMREEFGDMRFDGTIAEEAKSAVLNEMQEQVIQAELQAINQKRRDVAPFLKAANQEQQAAQRQGRELLSTMTPTLESVRDTARKIMARTALKNIKANTYSITARVASRRATAALAKQDWVNAGHFKQQELLNLALYREAGIVKERIEATKEQAKAFFKADATLAKTRNVDLVNVGRAILAQYGLGTQTEKTAAEYLEPIQKYDQDLYSQWKPQVDALAPRPVPYTALTVDEFTKLADDLDALWLLSRRTQQVKIEGQLLDRADVIEQLTAEIENKTTTERSRILGEQTKWEDTKLGLLSLTSALRRVESWVDAMDGGNINGIFRRFIWTPIQDAAVTFRTEKAKLLTAYLKLIQPIEGTMTRDLIPANELGQGFAFRGRSALLHAILHTGNESNKAKLLKGYEWDAAQWDAFVTRAWKDGTLTKADYDYAQGVWDLLESIKPQAQQAHHEMYGYYFNEITAAPIQTPWGEYKGGYVPAIADSIKSVDQAIRQEKDLFDQSGNSFMFPTTGRGFTKARVEPYVAPLALNLATIPVHLDKVMRFVHLEPRVKDAARLVTNKQFRSSLDAMNPTVAKDMLVPWLQRAAQQTVSSPGKNRHMDRFWRALRARTGAQIMVGNVVNTLQQFTGFSLSLVKVKAKYLRGGLVTYLKGPGTMAESIHARSPFMAQRLTTQIMDVQASIDEILLNPTKYEDAKAFMMKHGYFMQQGTQNIVDLITWAGAYDQQLADGAAEAEAVRAADAAVRQTQGSFDPESLSSFESGTPFVRAFTMFYSYFNMQANLLGSEFQKVAEGMGLKKGAGRAFYLYFVGFLIPAVIAETIVKSMGGFDADDEDGYLTESLSVFFGSQLRSALAFFPGVGPVALAGINAFNSKWYDDRISTSPVVSLVESAARAPHSLYQAMSEDGHSKRAVRDVLTLLGLVTGTPASALNRPVGYLADVYDGVATPENAVDVTRGLLSGKDVNRKK